MEGLRPEIPSNSRNSGWILYGNPRKLQIELFSLRIYLRIRKEKKEVSLLVERNTERHSFSLSHIRRDLRLTRKKGRELVEKLCKVHRRGMIDRPRIYRGANQRKNSTKKGGKRKRVERGNAHHADERSEIHFRADSSGRLTELRKPVTPF